MGSGNVTGDGRVRVHELPKGLGITLPLFDPPFEAVKVATVAKNSDGESRGADPRFLAVCANFFDEGLLFHMATLGHLAAIVNANRPMDKWP